MNLLKLQKYDNVEGSRQLAHYYQLPVTEGALIAQVEPYSPADDAGLRKGDIIEGKVKINDPSQVSSQVRKKHVIDQVSMIINRHGRRFEVPHVHNLFST